MHFSSTEILIVSQFANPNMEDTSMVHLKGRKEDKVKLEYSKFPCTVPGHFARIRGRQHWTGKIEYLIAGKAIEFQSLKNIQSFFKQNPGRWAVFIKFNDHIGPKDFKTVVEEFRAGKLTFASQPPACLYEAQTSEGLGFEPLNR